MEEASEQQCVSYEESGSRKVFIWPKLNKDIHYVSAACSGYLIFRIRIHHVGSSLHSFSFLHLKGFGHQKT